MKVKIRINADTLPAFTIEAENDAERYILDCFVKAVYNGKVVCMQNWGRSFDYSGTTDIGIGLHDH